MRTAKLWSVILWAATDSLVFGQEWPSPFRHLPENTMAVIHVRVDALLKSEWGKAALDDVLSKKDMKDSFQKIKSHLGIDPLEVESLTFLFLDPVLSGEQNQRLWQYNQQGALPPKDSTLPRNPIIPPTSSRSTAAKSEFVAVWAQAGGNNDFLPLVIVTAHKAIDRKQFMRKKADLVDAGQTRVGLLFLGNHSFVVGPDHAIVQFATNTSDKESDLVRQLTNEHRPAMIQGGYRLSPVVKKAVLAEFGGAGMLSMLIPFANLTYATFALDPGKAADFRIHLQAANDRQANLAAQSAKTLLAWTEARCEKSIPEMEKNAASASDAKAKTEAKDAIALTKTIRQMAAAARVDQRQSEVSVTLQMEIHAKQIVPLLQELFKWDANPRPTLAY
jgi:hypothetical protein